MDVIAAVLKTLTVTGPGVESLALRKKKAWNFQVFYFLLQYANGILYQQDSGIKRNMFGAPWKLVI